MYGDKTKTLLLLLLLLSLINVMDDFDELRNVLCCEASVPN